MTKGDARGQHRVSPDPVTEAEVGKHVKMKWIPSTQYKIFTISTNTRNTQLTRQSHKDAVCHVHHMKTGKMP